MLASIDRLTDRVLRRLVLAGLAACLGLGAIGVAAASLYHYLLDWMRPAAALGIVALSLAIIALVLARIAQAQSSPKRVAAVQGATMDSMPALVAAAGDMAGEAVKADPLGAMLGAGAMGFILESRPDLDHALVQQVLRQFTR
ncbi:hypothetical protein [Dongia sp.]|jgi:hypothetical protein|uniref:hypothetical protein n=1 Tax=Dongia sp. TaxID=1977262 RepID=UPI0035AF9BA0